jgi:hypothetical protein
VECVLQFSEITERLAREVSLFAPYGIDNPQPLFLSENVGIKILSPFPNGRFVSLLVRQGGRELNCLSPTKLIEGIPEEGSIIFSLDYDRQLAQPLLILKGWTREGVSVVKEERAPYLSQLFLWEEEFLYD